MFICVIDDDVNFARKISRAVESLMDKQCLNTQIIMACNSKELEELQVESFDIMFCDIDLGEECESGIQFSKKINQRNPRCQIIFVSSYLDYAPDAYCAEHVWFIPKERFEEQLPIALNKALNNLSARDSSYLMIKQGRGRITIRKSDIVCIESHQRKIAIYCVDGIEEAYGTIADLEKSLANDGFIRCHNSYIINIKMVVKYSPTRLILTKDMSLPISRQYKEQVKNTFMKYAVDGVKRD